MTPIQAVVPIVREFYANAPYEVLYGQSYVRGKSINYQPGDINVLFELPNFNGCDYMANTHSPVSVEEVCGVIVGPESV